MTNPCRNRVTRATPLLFLLFALFATNSGADSSALCQRLTDGACPYQLASNIERDTIVWNEEQIEVAVCRSAFCRDAAADLSNARIEVRVDGRKVCEQSLDKDLEVTCPYDFGISLRSRQVETTLATEAGVLAEHRVGTLEAAPKTHRFRLERDAHKRLDEEMAEHDAGRDSRQRVLRRTLLAIGADGRPVDELRREDLQLMRGKDPIADAILSVRPLPADVPRRLAVMVDVSGFIAHGAQSAHWRKSYADFVQTIAEGIAAFVDEHDGRAIDLVVTRFAALTDGKLFHANSETERGQDPIAERVRAFLSSPLPKHWVKAQIRHSQLNTIGATHFADLQLAQQYTREVWLEDEAASAALVIGPGRNNISSTGSGLSIPEIQIRAKNPLWTTEKLSAAIDDLEQERIDGRNSIYRRAAYSSMPFSALLTYESSFVSQPKKTLVYRRFFDSQGGFIARLRDHFEQRPKRPHSDESLSVSEALSRMLFEIDHSFEVVYRAPRPGTSLQIHTPTLEARNAAITLRTQAFGPPNTRADPAKPRRELLSLSKDRRFLAAYLTRYGDDDTKSLADLAEFHAREQDPQVRDILEESYCVLHIRRMSGAWSKRLRKESFVHLMDSPYGSDLCRRFRPVVRRIVTDEANLLGEGTTRRLLRRYTEAQ